jgi:hypothetical protein
VPNSQSFCFFFQKEGLPCPASVSFSGVVNQRATQAKLAARDLAPWSIRRAPRMQTVKFCDVAANAVPSVAYWPSCQTSAGQARTALPSG